MAAVTARRDRLRRPSWNGAVGAFVVLAGWLIGLRPLADNSFLTHLATGRIILDTGSVPSHDPYTFTAGGEPWVVQSWLASVVYATAEALAGLDGVRVVVAVVAASLAAAGWALVREADGLVARLALAGLFIGVGASLWAERPLMFGLLGLALVQLASLRRLDPRLLLPIGWLWVNVHGSFPLGVLYLVVAAIGRRLDGEPWDAERRALQWFVPGVLLGALGPLGPTVLWFPIALLRRQDVLEGVIEWKAPTFDTPSQRLFVLQLVVAVLLLARRPSQRHALVLAVFAAMALISLRNVTVASLVILPGMAAGAASLGSLRGAARPAGARVLGVAAVAAFVVLTAGRAGQVDLELRKYPVGALAFLEAGEVDTREVRLAGPDFVGNLLTYVYGPEQRVFYDDRFDMFPAEVSEVHAGLNRASAGTGAALERYDVALVVLPRLAPMAQVFTLDPTWRVLFMESEWTLLCRRGEPLGGDVGTC